jgi:hypothetical protein
MISLFLMAVVCSFGQEGQAQDSQAIIGSWIQVRPKNSGLGIMIITDREMIWKEILFIGYEEFIDYEESVSAGYKISNGIIVFDDGGYSQEYILEDNDTLFIELMGEYKRIRQDITLLNGSFYPDNDDREFDYDAIWEFTHIEFFDGKSGAFYILDISLPFEYEIYDIYLILKINHPDYLDYQRDVFIIKSNTVIEAVYTAFGDGSIFRKRE